MPPGTPPALIALHQRNNAGSAEAWARFTGHRGRVTALVAAALGPTGGDVAILGAGNLNDFDAAVLPAETILRLVDLDADAVAAARSRMEPVMRPRVIIHAPVDLSGTLADLPRWRRDPITPAELAALAGKSAAHAVASVPGPFDVVASTCFLSQLMHTCAVALGEDHPRIHLISCALAMGHLRAMTMLLRPGGTALLVTDMTSSDTYPLDELFAERGPRALLRELAATDNAFAGTNVDFVERILREDPFIAPLARDAEILDPWLWHFSAERTYLVYAARWSRSP